MKFQKLNIVSNIKLIEKRIKIWEQIRRNHFGLEPCPIFKKKYQKWEQQLLEYENIISHLYNEKLTNYADYYETINNSPIIVKNK